MPEDDSTTVRDQLRQGGRQAAVQLDRAGRHRRFRAGLRQRTALAAGRRPGADLSQPGAAEQPVSAPGALLEICRGEAPARQRGSAPCSTKCRRKCGCATPSWTPSAGPSARTTAASPPPRRCSPSRWKTSSRPAAVLRAPAPFRLPAPRVPRTTDPDAIQRELAQLQKTQESDTAKGAGDQPQAHRDPEQAHRKVRQDPGELRSGGCAVRRR